MSTSIRVISATARVQAEIELIAEQYPDHIAVVAAIAAGPLLILIGATLILRSLLRPPPPPYGYISICTCRDEELHKYPHLRHHHPRRQPRR